MEKVRVTEDGCWEWTNYLERNGYARIWVNRRNVGAHRWSYEHHVGPIPDGLVIDHLCRNPPCVNPDHLEPVTPRENVLRGIAPQVARERNASLTHCKRGHEFTEDNTRVDRTGGRICLACKRLKAREHYLNNRAAYIEKAREWTEKNPERAREVSRESQRRYRAKRKEA